LYLTVNDPTGTAAGQTNVFAVTSWFNLNGIINALAAAIICNNPGSDTCPNDCLPGGFCCAGGCLCATDCTETSTVCQAGYCKVDNSGATCALGAPNNAACQANVQCQDRSCTSTGCVGTPDNSLFCTDNNKCTNDFCSGGVCVSVPNNLTNCTDANVCTVNDHCEADGSCVGTPDDFATCDDGNMCTDNGCSGGNCVVTSTTSCTDPDTSDCITYICNPATGDCDPVPIKAGYECRPPPSNDHCKVYVCNLFDINKYTACVAANNGNDSTCYKGECQLATRDTSSCGSSTNKIGAIVGGTLAGVAFLAILCLCLLIFLLILCRKQIPQVIGGLNPFGGGSEVVTAPTYQASGSSGASGAYEGS